MDDVKTTPDAETYGDRYRELFDSVDAAVLLMRGSGCIACNPAAVELFGLRGPDDLVGATPLDFAPERQPDGRASIDVVRENMELAVRDGTHAFEWASRRADGTPLMLDVRFSPFDAPEGNLFLCTALDITERKRTEAALRRSEARYRAIFEAATAGILIADLASRRLRHANPAVCRMLGYDEAELRALRLDDLHPPEPLRRAIDEFLRQAGKESAEVRLPCRRKDGSTFDACIRTALIEIEGAPCVLGFVRDVTAEARVEEDRLRSQKLDAVGLLAGGIAHDFNNVLQGLLNTVAAAERAYDDRARCLALLREAETGLQLASGLTAQLLTFARGSAPAKKVLDPAPLVASAARLALAGSNAELRLEMAPGLWSVEGDEGQLAQVVQNLVVNARQAMPNGGVVCVRVRNVPEQAVSLERGPRIVVEVEDHGEGIPPQHLSRIFDPWFSTKATGRGLGLAVCHSVVTSHGGRIDARSAPGCTVFTVSLPALPVATSASSTVPEKLRPARILVMDDDEFVRVSVRALLRSMGHEVDCTPEGEAAVEAYRAARRAGRPYDLVILDLTVRDGLGGLAALEQLRWEDPDVTAVVSSGYSHEPVVADFRKYGFKGALPKPYSVETLERELAALLR